MSSTDSLHYHQNGGLTTDPNHTMEGGQTATATTGAETSSSAAAASHLPQFNPYPFPYLSFTPPSTAALTWGAEDALKARQIVLSSQEVTTATATLPEANFTHNTTHPFFTEKYNFLLANSPTPTYQQISTAAAAAPPSSTSTSALLTASQQRSLANPALWSAEHTTGLLSHDALAAWKSFQSTAANIQHPVNTLKAQSSYTPSTGNTHGMTHGLNPFITSHSVFASQDQLSPKERELLHIRNTMDKVHHLRSSVSSLLQVWSDPSIFGSIQDDKSGSLSRDLLQKKVSYIEAALQALHQLKFEATHTSEQTNNTKQNDASSLLALRVFPSVPVLDAYKASSAAVPTTKEETTHDSTSSSSSSSSSASLNDINMNGTTLNPPPVTTVPTSTSNVISSAPINWPMVGSSSAAALPVTSTETTSTKETIAQLLSTSYLLSSLYLRLLSFAPSLASFTDAAVFQQFYGLQKKDVALLENVLKSDTNASSVLTCPSSHMNGSSAPVPSYLTAFYAFSSSTNTHFPTPLWFDKLIQHMDKALVFIAPVLIQMFAAAQENIANVPNSDRRNKVQMRKVFPLGLNIQGVDLDVDNIMNKYYNYNNTSANTNSNGAANNSYLTPITKSRLRNPFPIGLHFLLPGLLQCYIRVELNIQSGVDGSLPTFDLSFPVCGMTAPHETLTDEFSTSSLEFIKALHTQAEVALHFFQTRQTEAFKSKANESGETPTVMSCTQQFFSALSALQDFLLWLTETGLSMLPSATAHIHGSYDRPLAPHPTAQQTTFHTEHFVASTSSICNICGMGLTLASTSILQHIIPFAHYINGENIITANASTPGTTAEHTLFAPPSETDSTEGSEITKAVTFAQSSPTFIFPSRLLENSSFATHSATLLSTKERDYELLLYCPEAYNYTYEPSVHATLTQPRLLPPPCHVHCAHSYTHSHPKVVKDPVVLLNTPASNTTQPANAIPVTMSATSNSSVGGQNRA